MPVRQNCVSTATPPLHRSNYRIASAVITRIELDEYTYFFSMYMKMLSHNHALVSQMPILAVEQFVQVASTGQLHTNQTDGSFHPV